MKTFIYLFIFLAVFWCAPRASAQILGQPKETVEVFPIISGYQLGKKCSRLQPGNVVFFLQPDYPSEARAAGAGGVVVVNIKLNENGIAPEIERVSGNKLLQATATDAARKVKFTPTLCDGVPVPIQVAMNYNFLQNVASKNYFKASKMEDFADVKEDSPFFEAIRDLTENQQLAFGYGNKSFYPDAPLTRSDFAQFLRLTLDLLTERARVAEKKPSEINLFYGYNPQNAKKNIKIKSSAKDKPFLDSVKILFAKYDISLFNERNEFFGREWLLQSETVDLWEKIFGADAVPVNFQAETGDRIMTRGEFALFLDESLGVLTYKVLP